MTSLLVRSERRLTQIFSSSWRNGNGWFSLRTDESFQRKVGPSCATTGYPRKPKSSSIFMSGQKRKKKKSQTNFHNFDCILIQIAKRFVDMLCLISIKLHIAPDKSSSFIRNFQQQCQCDSCVMITTVRKLYYHDDTSPMRPLHAVRKRRH